MALRDAIHRIALQWPSYGRPRITAELRRQGWTVNHKRVRRLLREDNLLCLRKRKFVVTNDSNHGRKVYPNLAGKMTLTGVDQLWVADITYVRLQEEFIFLAVILDAYSGRVIGWPTILPQHSVSRAPAGLGSRSPVGYGFGERVICLLYGQQHRGFGARHSAGARCGTERGHADMIRHVHN